MIEKGVIHGRFQVLHNDHLRYLLAGRSKCDHLVIGITNPDPGLTRSDPADPLRHRPEENPLTYFERYLMVKAALVESGSSPESFSVVPFPINMPELYQYYVPLDGTFFLTIYDSWGKKKQEMFQAMGLRIHVLWEKPMEEKGLNSTDIRKRMAWGEEWETMVPPSVRSLMKEWRIPERLARLKTP